MPQQTTLDLARQGNPSAIAALMNRTLQPKGITAKVNRKGRCLKIMLEAIKMPNQAGAVKLIYEGVKKLGIVGIDTLQIFGRQQGDDVSTWSQTIALREQQPIRGRSQQLINQSEAIEKDTENSTKLELLQSAKKGNLSAISTLMSQAFSDEQVTVEAQMLLGTILWLKLNALTKLNQELCLHTVIKTLNIIKLDKVSSVRISELSQANKDKQAWDKYVFLQNGEFVDNIEPIPNKIAYPILAIFACVFLFIGLSYKPSSTESSISTPSQTSSPVRCTGAAGYIWTNVRLYRDSLCEQPFATIVSGSSDFVTLLFDTGEVEVKDRAAVRDQAYVMTNDPAIDAKALMPTN